MTLASAARTCCDASCARSLTLGTIFALAASGPTSRATSPCAPGRGDASSASPSVSSASYAGRSSARADSAPTLSHSEYSCCATLYRTLQLLSAANFFAAGTTSATHSARSSSFPSAAQSSTANNRTLSCSSVVSFLNSAMISVSTSALSHFAANAPRC